MAEENQETPPPEKPRDKSGQYIKETEKEEKVRSQPNASDYVKMNAFMAIQLGLSDKLAELQTKHNPEELFKQLSFMHENIAQPTGQQGLPPNQQIAPTSSQSQDRNKVLKIPNFTQRGELNLKEGEYSFHGDISMIDLIKNKNKKKK